MPVIQLPLMFCSLFAFSTSTNLLLLFPKVCVSIDVIFIDKADFLPTYQNLLPQHEAVGSRRI